MDLKCYDCGKTSKGNMPKATINGEERTFCANCYWKLEKQYKDKKNCDDCAHFSDDKCKKTNIDLKPVTVGFNTYYIEAEHCKHLSTGKEAFLKEIQKLESSGRYEEASVEYVKLGMIEEAEEAKKKIKPSINFPVDATPQVLALVRKGKTLNYYCCHCGVKLKIGAKSPAIQKTCPYCKGDLEIIDISKLIKQHPQ